MAGKKRLNKTDRKIVAEEEAAAEQFMCEHVKPKGDLKYIDDGESHVFVNLKWPDLKTLLSRYGIARLVARMSQLHKGDQQTSGRDPE